jgi:hypothetical protein
MPNVIVRCNKCEKYFDFEVSPDQQSLLVECPEGKDGHKLFSMVPNGVTLPPDAVPIRVSLISEFPFPIRAVVPLHIPPIEIPLADIESRSDESRFSKNELSEIPRASKKDKD